MNVDGNHITLSLFIIAAAAIPIFWMNTKACSTVVTPVVVECAQACGPVGMSERDRDGNCRCRAVTDAGAGD
jgi:hypothetical protein